MLDLNGLLVFVRVAETRSFTQAATLLGLTPSAVSKAMTRLEEDVGARLLHRTTRSVDLTADGATFLERCRGALAEIEDAQTALAQTRVLPTGRLRVQMPVALGRRVIAPAMPEFMRRYPGLVLDAELSDRITDVIHEGLDASIILGAPLDGRLIARGLCGLRFRACASPAYLAAHGEPATPQDLDGHHCLAYVLPHTGRYRDWVFEKDGRTCVKTPAGRINFNNAESLLEAAVAGSGIVMLSNFITAEAVKSGALQPLFEGYTGLGPEVHVVYPPNRQLSARVRVFVEFLTELMKSSDGLHRKDAAFRRDATPFEPLQHSS